MITNSDNLVEMQINAGVIHVNVDDKAAYQRGKLLAAEMGESDNETIVKTATSVARKAVVKELEKTGAYNPNVESNVVIESIFPIKI